jgi:large subunit ribosomal protein L35
MPKLKTNRAAAKRVKRTKTGKYLRKSAFVRHKLTKKSRKRKRQLGKSTLVHDTDVGRIKLLLPYSR